MRSKPPRFNLDDCEFVEPDPKAAEKMRLFDAQPQPIKDLMNEYGVNAVLNLQGKCADTDDLRAALEKRRRERENRPSLGDILDSMGAQ